MAFPIASLPFLFAINAVLAAVFFYALYEGFRLSRPDFDTATDLRPPWAEKLVMGVSGLLNLVLIAIAVGLAYRYYDAL